MVTIGGQRETLREKGERLTRERIDIVVAAVRAELERATDKFGSFASAHEGYAVLLEEVDELWDEVKANEPELAAAEAVQVAAMGCRYLFDLGLPGEFDEEHHP